MQNYIDVSKIKEKEIYSLGKNFFGEGSQGTIGFTNYYLEENGTPFFGIAGECHYARVHDDIKNEDVWNQYSIYICILDSP